MDGIGVEYELIKFSELFVAARSDFQSWPRRLIIVRMQ